MFVNLVGGCVSVLCVRVMGVGLFCVYAFYFVGVKYFLDGLLGKYLIM